MALSQSSKVLTMLKEAGKKGVPNYKFPQANILRYSARIGDLRKEGYGIVAERQVINGKHTGVFNYVLVSRPKALHRYKLNYEEVQPKKFSLSGMFRAKR